MSDIHTLLENLRREADPIDQSKLIEELGHLRAQEAVEMLIPHAIRNEYQSGSAIVALGNIGDPRAIDALVLSFNHQNLAWIAKDALVKIGPVAVNALVQALNHDNPDVRFMAIRTLGELNDPGAIGPLEKIIESDPDDTNQKQARNTLKILLFENLPHQDAKIRQQVIDRLEWLGDARAVDRLLEIVDHDPDATTRQIAQSAITSLLQKVDHDPFDEHNPSLLSRETKLLVNQLRRRAALPIETPDNAVMPSLAADVVTRLRNVAAQHADDATREIAGNALRRAAVDLVCAARYPEARRTAVETLGGINDPAARRLVEQVAQYDPNDAVRQAAQRVLDR